VNRNNQSFALAFRCFAYSSRRKESLPIELSQ